MKVAAVILAAGAGRRFGGPKQLAELDGRPLIDHVVEAVEAVPGLDRRVVVVGAHAEEVRRALTGYTGLDVVECADWREGMSASLRAGIAAVRDCDAAIVLLADTPHVTPQVIAQVLDSARRGVPAARVLYDGEPGHPVMLARRLFGEVARLRGDRGARELLERVGPELIEAGPLARGEDVDTPADLAAARRTRSFTVPRGG